LKITTVKQVLLNLIHESNEDIFSKISSTEKKHVMTHVYIPEFNQDETHKGLIKKKIINWKKIVYQHENDVLNLASYKIAATVLRTYVRKKHVAFDKKLVLDLDDFIKKTIFDFITTFLNHLNSKKQSNDQAFTFVYEKLNNYLQNELFSVFCFTTLRNFDGPHTRLLLPNEQVLRLRTVDEFASVCNIKEVADHAKINPNFHKIKFIVGTYVPKTEISEQKISERFEKFLFALKIFHVGNVQFGGIYYRESADWDVKSIICLKPEPILGKPKIKYLLESDSLSQKDFKKFADDFFGINMTKGKYVFLGRSIKRFSQAIENENELDKIVDFITCLESLYSSNEQELSYRFAMRTANVLGTTPNQKILIQNFILQIYNLRSKIVHGDDIPQIKVNNKEVDLDSCLKMLEQISRYSIKIFLQLLNNFNNKEEIHQMLDNSIYDMSLQKNMLKILKKLKLSNVMIV
jgi:hypothetical protein